jgi:hypothetical protein
MIEVTSGFKSSVCDPSLVECYHNRNDWLQQMPRNSTYQRKQDSNVREHQLPKVTRYISLKCMPVSVITFVTKFV